MLRTKPFSIWWHFCSFVRPTWLKLQFDLYRKVHFVNIGIDRKYRRSRFCVLPKLALGCRPYSIKAWNDVRCPTKGGNLRYTIMYVIWPIRRLDFLCIIGYAHLKRAFPHFYRASDVISNILSICQLMSKWLYLLAIKSGVVFSACCATRRCLWACVRGCSPS